MTKALHNALDTFLAFIAALALIAFFTAIYRFYVWLVETFVSEVTKEENWP